MLLNQNYKDVEMLIQQWLFWVPVYVCVCACLSPGSYLCYCMRILTTHVVCSVGKGTPSVGIADLLLTVCSWASVSLSFLTCKWGNTYLTGLL